LVKVSIDDEAMKRFSGDIEFLKHMTDIQLPLTMQNIGKTPATNIRTVPKVMILPSTTEPPLQKPPQGYNMRLVLPILFPTATADMTTAMRRYNGERAVMTDDEREGLRSGKYYLIYFGRLEYTDGFGPHWTNYCGWHGFTSDGAFKTSSCSYFNAIDQE